MANLKELLLIFVATVLIITPKYPNYFLEGGCQSLPPIFVQTNTIIEPPQYNSSQENHYSDVNGNSVRFDESLNTTCTDSVNGAYACNDWDMSKDIYCCSFLQYQQGRTVNFLLSYLWIFILAGILVSCLLCFFICPVCTCKVNAGSRIVLHCGVLYMNTYRLESQNPFNANQVEKVIREVLNKQCIGIMYDVQLCKKLVQSVADEIRLKVKEFEFERYRLIVVVQMGEKRLQGFESGVRFLWDATRDRYANVTYENNSLFVTATCFGVYRD